MRILIIEDEPVVWALLQRIIQDMKHDVAVASDGQQGLDMARQGGFAVIVSDLQMPGAISGLELIRQLRTAQPLTPTKRVDASKSATSARSSSGPSAANRTVASASGSGWRRTVTVVMSASVPSDPTSRRGTSNPATFFTTFPPPFARTPSARTNAGRSSLAMRLS